MTFAATRVQLHRALHLIGQTARANLETKEDDSQSNTGWDDDFGGLVSRQLVHGVQAGLQFDPPQLHVMADEGAQLEISGLSVDEAQAWLDEQLNKRGLKGPSSAPTTYELPERTQEVQYFDGLTETARLSALYRRAAAALTELVGLQAHLHPGPSPVRCWPHHFDIATYVSLAEESAEEAPGIGVGLAPGDSAHEAPYLYVNPWPHPAKDSLREAPEPAFWLCEGFVGLVTPAEAEGLDYAKHLQACFTQAYKSLNL